MPKYLLYLENAFSYMDNYNYHKGMNAIVQELKGLLKTKSIGTDSDCALSHPDANDLGKLKEAVMDPSFW